MPRTPKADPKNGGLWEVLKFHTRTFIPTHHTCVRKFDPSIGAPRKNDPRPITYAISHMGKQ